MDVMTGIRAAMVVKDIYVAFTEEEPEPDLDEDLLVLLRAFKAGYDAKDATILARSFSKDYVGTMWGYKSKADVVEFFRESFEGLPFLVRPKLRVTVLKSAINARGVAKVTVDFVSNVAVAKIPVLKFDLGRLVVTAKMNKASGLFLITRLDDAR